MQLDLPTPLSTLYSSTQLEMDFSLLLVESTKVFNDLHLMKQQVKNINILLLVCHRPTSILLHCIVISLMVRLCIGTPLNISISSGEINDKPFHFESTPMDDFPERNKF